jgi:hypothetical protein
MPSSAWKKINGRRCLYFLSYCFKWHVGFQVSILRLICTKTLKLTVANETRGSLGWTCVAHLLFCFDETSKPLSQLNRNLVWSISGRSSIKNAHFVPISGKIKQKISLFYLDWEKNMVDIGNSCVWLAIFF